MIRQKQNREIFLLSEQQRLEGEGRAALAPGCDQLQPTPIKLVWAGVFIDCRKGESGYKYLNTFYLVVMSILMLVFVFSSNWCGCPEELN